MLCSVIMLLQILEAAVACVTVDKVEVDEQFPFVHKRMVPLNNSVFLGQESAVNE